MPSIDIRHFKSFDYPDIARISNQINIAWPERPKTSAGWMEADRNRNPGNVFQRLVAIIDGCVTGFASFSQNKFEFSQDWYSIDVEVSLENQRKGVGTALYNQLLDELLPHKPQVLRGDAFTHLPQGIQFLMKRGFFEAFRETPVHLDPSSFNSAPYSSLNTKLLEKGLTILTLSELEKDANRNHKLYDLYWEVNDDVPHEDIPTVKPGYEEWLEWGVNHPSILKDAYFIAVHGDEYVGLSEWGIWTGNNALLGGLMGVRRAYRGQGIALAMMLRAIEFTRQNGHPELKTCTAVQNHPMQTLFNKLGFSRDPEWLQCQKNLINNIQR